jgi:hypothetical protein
MQCSSLMAKAANGDLSSQEPLSLSRLPSRD